MKCPKKELESILMALNPLFKELTSLEPGREDIEEIERNKNPDVSEEEIERRYKEHIWIYHQFQKESKKAEQIIRKYGKDKEEIKEKLKIHFNQCEKCRQVYLKKLDKIAEAHMEIAERVLGKSEKSYFALIKEWDFLKYLQH